MPPAFARFLLHLVTITCLAGAAWTIAWGMDVLPQGWGASAASVGIPGTSEPAGGLVGASTLKANGDGEAAADPSVQPASWSWTKRRFQGPLFDPPPAVVPPPPPPVPPPLTLRGTVAEGGQSRAFVAGRDGVPRVMRVGEEVDGATLLSVAVDHAMFTFRGREHRLELTK